MAQVATTLNALLLSRQVRKAGVLDGRRAVADHWSFSSLAGHLVELLSGPVGARLSAAVDLVCSAQRKDENVVWLSRPERSFFPPDAERAGVDLNALVIVHLHRDDDLFLAADKLVRSGGFGLVVVDLSGGSCTEPARKGLAARQSRLSGLARTHNAAVVLLRDEHDGTLMSVCVTAERSIAGPPEVGSTASAQIEWPVVVTASRDRRSRAGWTQELCHLGPDGMR